MSVKVYFATHLGDSRLKTYRKCEFFFDRGRSYPYDGALMLTTLSQKQFPRLGDPRKFAQQGVTLEGFVAVSDLPRLASALEAADGEIAVRLQFAINEEGKRAVTGHAVGKLPLKCQRCLEAVYQEVESNISLGIVWDEEAAKSLPAYLDPWIAGEGAADFYEMIEEEVLLSLPIVAYHDELCVDRSLFSSGKPVEVKETKNPFKVLEQLKSSPK